MKARTIYVLLLLLTVFEVIAQTYGQRYGSKDIAAIVYVLSGILIGVLPLLKTTAALPIYHAERTPKWKLLPFVFLLVGIVYFGGQAIHGQALDYTFADMLPIIQIMGERWLADDEVYAVIPEIWNGMQPIYLPMMWLPYVPAIGAKVDIRWINILFIIMASGLATHFWQLSKRPIFQSFAIYIPLLILLSYVLINYTTFITISEESIVVGFYLLLAYGVLRSNSKLIIFALVGCLLSRYALIFWAATYVIYLYIQGGRQQVIRIAVGAALLGLLLMYASQGIYQLELFYSLKDAYVDSFVNPDIAWRTQDAVSKNIGLARFVAFEQLIVMHRAVFWGSIILPPLLHIWYHLKLKARIAYPLFAVCSLKLCLVYFFNMNALPYSYLFYTSTFLSFIVVQGYVLNQSNA